MASEPGRAGEWKGVGTRLTTEGTNRERSDPPALPPSLPTVLHSLLTSVVHAVTLAPRLGPVRFARRARSTAEPGLRRVVRRMLTMKGAVRRIWKQTTHDTHTVKEVMKEPG